MGNNAFIRIKINSAEKFRYLHSHYYMNNRKNSLYFQIKFTWILFFFNEKD